MGVDVIIPVFNQLHYTQTCIETLLPTLFDGVRIIVIDNGSTDGTGEWLRTIQGITVISNDRNLGCAAAWNQGVKAGSSPWAIIVNNDVIFPQGWLEGLLQFAETNDVDIACPGLREGELNYDVTEYAADYMKRMASASRYGDAHGVCFMVRRTVFGAIGYFDEKFTIGGSEDTDFFWRSMQTGFRLALTGSSFLHHFGCVTQNYIKAEILGRCYGPEHRAHFRQKWKLNWWKRFLLRRRGQFRNLCWATGERLRFGHTLREKWIKGKLRYY